MDLHGSGSPINSHQVVMFEYNHKDIIVHGEDDSSIYRDESIQKM